MRSARSVVAACVASFAVIAAHVVGMVALPSAAPPSAADEVLRGRVLGEGRFPVAGAEVVVLREQDGETVSEQVATTDAAGEFAVSCRWSESSDGAFRGVVFARAAGRAASADVSHSQEQRLRREPFRLREPLVLLPAQVWAFEVVDGAGPVDGATVELDDQVGYALDHARCVERGVTDDAGRVTLAPMPPGQLRVVARHPVRGTVSRVLDGLDPLASAATPLRLELAPVRDVIVTVFDLESGRPIVGAEVIVEEVAAGSENASSTATGLRRIALPRAERTTDAHGRVLVRGLPTELPLRIDARAKGYDVDWRSSDIPEIPDDDRPSETGFSARIVEPKASTAVLRLRRQVRRFVRVELEPSGATPPDGTPLQVVTAISLSLPPPWRSLFPDDERLPTNAVVRDGGIELAALEVAGSPYFRRGGCMRGPMPWVIAPDGAMAVLSENSVGIRGPGGATRFEASAPLSIEVRDAQGRPVAGVQVFVGRVDPEASTRGASTGAYGTTDGDGRVGFARLPVGRYDVSAQGVKRVIELPLTAGPVVLPARELPTREVRFEFTQGGQRRLPERFYVAWNEPGFTESSERIEEPASGALRCFVSSAAGAVPRMATLGIDGVRREPIELPSPRLEGPLVVPVECEQLRRQPNPSSTPPPDQVRVSVVWRAPPGESLAFAEVRASGDFEDWGRVWPTYGKWRGDEWWPMQPKGDDTEAIAWRRGTVPTLSIRHPYLVSAPCNQSLDLSMPRTALTLHLEPGPMLSFVPHVDGVPASVHGAWVRFARVDAADATDAELHAAPPLPALRRGDSLVLAPPAAGRWRMAVEIPGRAPVELPAVELTGATQSLGALDFPRGSSVTVRVAPPAGVLAPAVGVLAERLDGFAYVSRSIVDAGATRVPSLAAGRWRLRATPHSYVPGIEWTTEVTVDGIHDAEVTIVAD